MNAAIGGITDTDEGLQKILAELALHRELMNRLHLCCGDFHHNPNEYHKHLDQCPIMKKYKDLIP
jgi:hypothetical protein